MRKALLTATLLLFCGLPPMPPEIAVGSCLDQVLWRMENWPCPPPEWCGRFPYQGPNKLYLFAIGDLTPPCHVTDVSFIGSYAYFRDTWVN